MKKIVLFSVLLFNAFFILGQSNPCRLKIGMCLSDLSFWNSEQPFVDFMKMCSYWTTTPVAYYIEPGANPDSIPKDADGYPLQIPFTLGGLPRTVYTRMSTAQGFGKTGTYPGGKYVVLYDGTGVLRFSQDARVDSTMPHRMVLSVTPSNAGILMQIESSSNSDHVRNIRILMPGKEFTYLSKPFNQAFLDKIAPFPVLRYMNWGNTFNNNTTTWESRNTVTSYTQGSYDFPVSPLKQKGCAFEYMIKLSNLLQKDMWIAVPHKADSSCIAKMAQLVRDSLSKNLKVYLEYSNEIFNPDYTEHSWVGDTTNNKLFPGLGPLGKDTAKRAAFFTQRAFRIWYNVFGSQARTRIVRVAGAWNDFPSWVDSIMVQLRVTKTRDTADAIATGPYFGNDPALVYDRLRILGPNATAAHVIRYARDDLNTYAKRGILAHTALAKKYRVSLLFYEGGQHVLPLLNDVYKYNKAIYAAQRDTGMYTLYKDFLKFVRDSSTADLFMNFNDASPADSLISPIGPFGALESVYQDISKDPAPKYKALLDFMGTCVPSAVKAIEGGADNSDLFPNPCNENFYLRISANENSTKVKLEIHNLMGQQVHSGLTSFSGNLHDPVTVIGLPNGLYLVQISLEDQQIRKKIIIQH